MASVVWFGLVWFVSEESVEGCCLPVSGFTWHVRAAQAGEIMEFGRLSPIVMEILDTVITISGLFGHRFARSRQLPSSCPHVSSDLLSAKRQLHV